MGVSRKSTAVNVSPKKLYIHFLSSKTITINKVRPSVTAKVYQNINYAVLQMLTMYLNYCKCYM